MDKLHLPATVYSTYNKAENAVNVEIDGGAKADTGWDIIKEVAEANGMSVPELVAKLEGHTPFVFSDCVEFHSDTIDLNDVNVVV